MNEPTQELAAVEQLLAERDALHGWLTRLDQAASGVPESVRDRVRRDYQQRLDQLTAGLRAHADVIAAKLRDDRREQADLTQRATVAREALAEAELRHAVGEYDHARVEAERTRHRSDIETFELSLSAVAERVGRLQEVHALVQRAPRVEPDILPVEEAERPLTPPEVHVIENVDQELLAMSELSPDAAPEDVLAIFESDDDTPARPATAPRAETQNGSPGGPGPLSFRPTKSVEQARPTPTRPRVEQAPPLGNPTAHTPPRFVRPGERIRVPSSPPAPPVTRVPAAVESVQERTHEPFAEEIIASGPVAEIPAPPAGRTLRCAECGAMNRPLEWYCEKCGAELTAV